MGAKKGQADKQQRITEAYRLLCLRTPYCGVVKELVRIFNICDRTAKADIASASELIKADFEPDRQLAKNAGLALRNQLLVRALKDEDYKLSLAIAVDTAKLEGLYQSDFNQAISLIVDTMGWLVIDPSVDNLPLYQKLYFDALARQEKDYPNGTPKSPQEMEDDNSEDCGYRRSYGTTRRPDLELIHEIN